MRKHDRDGAAGISGGSSVSRLGTEHAVNCDPTVTGMQPRERPAALPGPAAVATAFTAPSAWQTEPAPGWEARLDASPFLQGLLRGWVPKTDPFPGFAEPGRKLSAKQPSVDSVKQCHIKEF